MKSASRNHEASSHAANGKLSNWTARSMAARSSVDIIERSSVAVEEAKMAVEDTRVSVADSKALATRYGIRRLGRR